LTLSFLFAITSNMKSEKVKNKLKDLGYSDSEIIILTDPDRNKRINEIKKERLKANRIVQIIKNLWY